MQYREGDILDGSDGKTYVVQNGVPTLMNASAAAPSAVQVSGPDPKLALERIKAQQDIEKAVRDAARAPVQAQTDQVQLQRQQLALSKEQSAGGGPAPVRIPPTAFAGIQENLGALRKIDEALRQINPKTGRPQSIGPGTGFFGDYVTQFNDPAGTTARSAIGQIGAVKIHDLSGAAVSPTEAPRFVPFVPKVDDRPEVARQKLESFRKELVGIIQEQETAYSPANGYLPYKSKLGTLSDYLKASGQPAAGNVDDSADVSPEVANSQQYREAYRQKHGEYPPITVSVIGGKPAQPPSSGAPGGAPPPGSYGDSILGQGLSGVNEGIANTLGMPVDLTTAALNLIPKGINAVANTNIGQIEHPFGGSETFRNGLTAVGSILPESQTFGRPFVRRVGQTIGANAIPVAAGATSLGRLTTGLLSSLGAGVGGATAEEVAPGNPYATLAGEVLGGGITSAAALGSARRKAASAATASVPSIDDLRALASRHYASAEARGVVAGPNVTSNLAGRLNQIARDEVAVTPAGHPLPGYDGVHSTTKLVGDYAGKNMSATEIDRVRRAVAANIQRAGDSNERRIGKQMLDAFDQETLPLAPEFTDARKVASRYLQAEDIQKARDLAEARAAQFSQSGAENATRTEFRALDRAIVKGDAAYPEAVANAINATSRGDWLTNTLRSVGKLSPRGPVSLLGGGGAAFGIGNSIGGPATGAALSASTMAAAELARKLATARTLANAARAEMLARSGGVAPIAAPVLDAAAYQQMAGQGAATINDSLPLMPRRASYPY